MLTVMPQTSVLFIVHQTESSDRFTENGIYIITISVSITSSRYCLEGYFHFSSQ